MSIAFERLYGRLLITGQIRAVTGLHIGGSERAFAIGANDNPVITDPVNGQPYIPGSSLRGKLRSLTEKYQGKVTGQRISRGQIHSCRDPECTICRVYGRSADEISSPTRLIVRDIPLLPASAEQLRQARMDYPYTELKTEVSIDRVTSQANPRPVERVPAGAIFGPLELVLSFYTADDVQLFDTLLEGMALLEDDYLGGHGSRGSGKIAFSHLGVTLKRGTVESQLPVDDSERPLAGLSELAALKADLVAAADGFFFKD